MTKHTPGPWHVSDPRPYASTHCVDVIGGLSLVAQCVPQSERNTEKANARLIAAAPDLLAALKGLLGDRTLAGMDKMEQEEIDAALAAIAKAEGRK